MHWKSTLTALITFFGSTGQSVYAHIERFKNYLSGNYETTCLRTGFQSSGEQLVWKRTPKTILLSTLKGRIVQIKSH